MFSWPDSRTKFSNATFLRVDTSWVMSWWSIVIASMVMSLNEFNIFRITFTFRFNFFLNPNPSINEVFLWQQTLEYLFPIRQVKSMQIFCFDFLLRRNDWAIKRSQLRNMKYDLKSVVLPILNRVKWKVKFSKQREFFNELHLSHFRNVILAQNQKPQTLTSFQSF
jgi:hypothetical protein